MKCSGVEGLPVRFEGDVSSVAGHSDGEVEAAKEASRGLQAARGSLPAPRSGVGVSLALGVSLCCLLSPFSERDKWAI